MQITFGRYHLPQNQASKKPCYGYVKELQNTPTTFIAKLEEKTNLVCAEK